MTAELFSFTNTLPFAPTCGIKKKKYTFIFTHRHYHISTFFSAHRAPTKRFSSFYTTNLFGDELEKAHALYSFKPIAFMYLQAYILNTTKIDYENKTIISCDFFFIIIIIQL